MDKGKLVDEKDREILKELKKNCKQPVRKIAKKLGLRITTTYDRIRRMEKEGVIQGYSAKIDPTLVGVPSCVFILVRLSQSSKISQFSIGEKVSRLRGVSECHIITGDHDMIIKVRGEDISKIGKLILNEIRMIEGVERTTTMAVIESISYGSNVPL